MKNTVRNGVIFNAFSGGINAVQSVIWMMIITRVLGIKEAGIFTIAYATSNLFLMIGKYGVRNFQVSDVKKCYSWNEYYISRVITTISMMLAIGIYCIYMHIFGTYSLYKAMVVFLMTLLKAADAYEDVYYGMYQQNGRLDIAGLAMSIRLGLQLIFLSACVMFKMNLVVSLIATNLFSWGVLLILLNRCNRFFQFNNSKVRIGELKNIFRLCAPLFLNGFISYYVCNLSKYAIDKYMGESAQAYYGFISMPVFVVYLFTNFIYQPMLKDISELWVHKEKQKFLKKISSALLLIGVISICVLAGGWLIGIWGLELLYGVELTEYKMEFLILLLGSVFYAFSSFFCVLLTVMRKQKAALYVYLIVFVISKFATNYLVKNNGIMGASAAYLITMGIIAVAYFCIVAIQINKTDTK